MLIYNEEDDKKRNTAEVACFTSNYKFGFDMKKGWLQTTNSGNRVYANKHRGHGKVIGGANEFARANAKDLRSADKFPVNPQGVSDTVLYHCLRHDYVYYPQDFADVNGVQRKRGFYDEECNYHEKIEILYYPQSSGVVCKYCGHNTIFDVNAQKMDDFWCSQCGAEIDYMKQLDAEYDFLVDCPGIFFYAKDISNPELIIESNRNNSEENEKELLRKQNEQKAFREKDNNEEHISKLNFDEPLQYIKAREYNPAPVVKQTYEPHKYNSKKTENTWMKKLVWEILEAVFPITEISIIGAIFKKIWTILNEIAPSDFYKNEFMEGPHYSDDKK